MKKGLKKQIALLLSAMMIFSTSANAFPVMAEDNLIFEKAENNTINSDYEFYNSESEITVTTCENKENPLEMETEITTVSTTTEVSVQSIEEQTESNPVEVYNSNYAVYADSDVPEGNGNENNPYQISNSSQLYWFAQQVNSGKRSISAILTADIVVNNNLLDSLEFDEDGNVTNDENFEKWTPIGNNSNQYAGTFDGQNHTISGLYFNNENSNYVGLVGYNVSGTIKNVGIIDSYFKGKQYVSGICGNNYNGPIENSYNTGSVIGSEWYIGGICGNNYWGKIKNNYNIGLVSGSVRVGGICGANSWGTIENNYYRENCNAEGIKFTNSLGIARTSEQFASGEVAYSLQDNQETVIWGQEIGKDKLPVLNGKKVYQNTVYSGCCEKYQGNLTYDYSNTQADTTYLENHNFENGICTACGAYEFVEPIEKDGYYQIENANHLYWLAHQVNNGNININAVLTADIVVSNDLLNSLEFDEDGNVTNGENFGKWILIGNSYSNKYTGTFDGNNYTISGLYFNDENTDYVGLFGYNSGTIKNVGIVDSYFKGKSSVGSICGENVKGTIENSYNIGTVNGAHDVGGICGENYGTIENSYNTGTVNGSSSSVGGVCGLNNQNGIITNSYNEGSVSGSSNIGGICGLNFNNGKIEKSYNTGSVSGSNGYIGGVCGWNSKGKIENSYNIGSVNGGTGNYVGGICGHNDKNCTITNTYNAGSVSGSGYYIGGLCGRNYGDYGTFTNSYNNSSVYRGKIVGYDSYGALPNNVLNKTSEQFTNGEVAYLLQGKQGTEIWGQEIGIDGLPVLNGKKVYKNDAYSGCCEKYQGETTYYYSNTKTDTKIYLKEVHNFENGICKACGGAYELIEPTETDGYYQIENVNHLYWFAYQVNNGNVNINAVLTADIVANKNVLNANGTLNSGSTLIEWTPIGNESNKYMGTFDGNNHTISGFYFNNENIDYVGLFGWNSGTIKNIGIIDSYFKGKSFVGGFCGGNDGTIENSYNAGTIDESNWYVGGVCGFNYEKIENSYNTGSVSGAYDVGGVCGNNCYSGTIENSYNIGSVNGSEDVGGICGINDNSTNSTVTNSYYLENCNAEGTTFTNDLGTAQTSEQFASGEVAYHLQEKQEIWGQEIGKDKLPVLNGKKVYQNIIYSGCCKEYQGDITYDYSNTQKNAVYLKETHNFENGICTGCETYEPAQLVDNYYQIGNAGNLLWFAQQVNNGNTNINAVLTADIVVNTNVLNADGTLVTGFEKLRIWTPIGNESNKYTGIFDGNNHTISGLYFNNENINYVGLFGYNSSGTIKNIGIVDLYFKGRSIVGGVCANNYGTIENSYNIGSVSGLSSVGGVCGYNNGGEITKSYNTGSVSGSSSSVGNVGGVCGQSKGTIENSYNTGSVSGAGNSIGGVCGHNWNSGTIKNSYNTGTVSGSAEVGGVCGYNWNGTIENSYYNNSVYSGKDIGVNDNGTVNKVSGKTSEQFASGEVAYLLGKIWGQEIGKDNLPVLNSENKVYKVTAYLYIKEESGLTTISETYTNNFAKVTAPIKEGYNFDGWYDNVENKICSSREYDLNVTADSEFIAVYEPLGTANITINCDREYTINGVSKSSATTEKYSIGSTIKLSCSDENFAYWQNSAGTILSRESEYSFVVTNEETISAVFNEKVDNKVTLIFESFYGQVIATEQLGSGERIDNPDLPVRTGYNALGWDYNGDGKYDKNDTLENAIEIGLKLDSKTVKIVPVYELINETHKITVENGEGSGTYNQNDIVTATSNKAETGMKFSHWEDSDGNVLSYNEKYVFYVSKDMTVKSIYVKTETKVDAKGTTGIVELNKTTNNKLLFVSMSTVPEGCKINKAGIIATDDSKLANSSEFTDKNAKFVRGMSSDKKAVRYTWTKGNVKSGQTWYVRAYLVYTDSNGNVHTVYGDMVSQTY